MLWSISEWEGGIDPAVDPESVVGPADVYSVDRERGPPVFAVRDRDYDPTDARNRENDAWDRENDPVKET